MGSAGGRGEVAVVDVRAVSEWARGHIPGTPNIPVGRLVDHLDEMPRDRPLVMQCQGGGRSIVAASLLQAHGFTNVVDLAGGFSAWEAAGQPVHRGVETAVLADA